MTDAVRDVQLELATYFISCTPGANDLDCNSGNNVVFGGFEGCDAFSKYVTKEGKRLKMGLLSDGNACVFTDATLSSENVADYNGDYITPYLYVDPPNANPIELDFGASMTWSTTMDKKEFTMNQVVTYPDASTVATAETKEVLLGIATDVSKSTTYEELLGLPMTVTEEGSLLLGEYSGTLSVDDTVIAVTKGELTSVTSLESTTTYGNSDIVCDNKVNITEAGIYYTSISCKADGTTWVVYDDETMAPSNQLIDLYGHGSITT